MSENEPKEEITVDGVRAEPTTPTTEEAAADQAPPTDATPAANLKEGLGLLWKAATGTAQELKREIDRAGVSETLQQAGRDLESAANQAAQSIEQIIGKVQPKAPNYTKEWPGSEPAAQTPETPETPRESSETSAEEDGGSTESGERRDMRIQVEDE